MPFPQSSIDQANYDAYTGKVSDPTRNAFQKALDNLQKITGKAPQPSPPGRTSAQQVAFDAKAGGKAMKAYGKGGGVSVPQLPTTGVGPALRGGASAAIYAGATAATPHIAKEAVRGFGVVTGMDTSGFDAINSGKPVVKSVNGVDFNVATPEGRAGYKKAGGLEKQGSSALASLGRYDDIPAAQYPEGVSTGVGGGNAGQAQSTDPNGDAYIPPTPRNTSGVDSGGGGTRVNAAGVVQKGRNFDSMASGLFNDIASRYEKDGFSSPETVALIKGMGEGTSFSSNRLPATADSLYTNTQGAVDAFEKPDLAINTGAKQNTDVNVGFQTKDATQFEAPDAELTNITTEAGAKQPVEYTNHMRNTDIGGLDALRMNEKQHGLIYASGQYWAKGADGNAVKVDRDLAKGVKRGAEGASSQLAAYLKNGGSKPEDGGFEPADTDIPTSVADKPSQQELAPSDQVKFTQPDEERETYGTQYPYMGGKI